MSSGSKNTSSAKSSSSSKNATSSTNASSCKNGSSSKTGSSFNNGSSSKNGSSFKNPSKSKIGISSGTPRKFDEPSGSQNTTNSNNATDSKHASCPKKSSKKAGTLQNTTRSPKMEISSPESTSSETLSNAENANGTATVSTISSSPSQSDDSKKVSITKAQAEAGESREQASDEAFIKCKQCPYKTKLESSLKDHTMRRHRPIQKVFNKFEQIPLDVTGSAVYIPKCVDSEGKEWYFCLECGCQMKKMKTYLQHADWERARLEKKGKMPAEYVPEYIGDFLSVD